MSDQSPAKRIDKGIKRGPRPNHRASPVPLQDRGSYTIPPDLDGPAILQRMLTERTTGAIAADYGIARKALTRWLRTKYPEQWREIMLIRALARKEDSDDGMEVAEDALSLARARERLRSAQFDLERLDSDTWGQKDKVQIDQTVTFAVDSDAFGSAAELALKIRRGRVVDAQQVDEPETQAIDSIEQK